tara:strand:+ start:388 stop:924 length:537 start_codon:yes stop_codon:yes gene_type:complete
MAYQKLQVSEGLNVIPSDTVPIPDPGSVIVLDVATGDTVGTAAFTANTLTTATPANPKFTEAGIKVGAIVYNETAGVAYTVTAVTSDTVLAITPATTGGATDKYTIYTDATKGCVLYVGGAGNVTAQLANSNANYTAASRPLNQELTFKNLPNASFLPVQVIRVDASVTTATDIIALW